ncbi:MAG: hypothetical protein VKJ24_08515 [Synechococcales bacterium]|nr:hypothetical protein [Synechococcales bacterium]
MTGRPFTTRISPWGSLFLLLGAYTLFGKFLRETLDPTIALWVSLLLGLSISLLFIHPLTDLGKIINKRFQSDAVAFTSLVGLAAFTAILLNWFKLFMPILMLLTSETLARIDIQYAKFSELQAYAMLTTTAWLGLASGWLIGTAL